MYISSGLKKMNVEFGPEQPANAEIQALIDNGTVLNAVAEKLKHQTNMYNAVRFRVQNLMGGTNWVVKVKIGERKHDNLHLMINRVDGVGVSESPQLTGLQQGHTVDDPLVPF